MLTRGEPLHVVRGWIGSTDEPLQSQCDPSVSARRWDLLKTIEVRDVTGFESCIQD